MRDIISIELFLIEIGQVLMILSYDFTKESLHKMLQSNIFYKWQEFDILILMIRIGSCEMSMIGNVFI